MQIANAGLDDKFKKYAAAKDEDERQKALAEMRPEDRGLLSYYQLRRKYQDRRAERERKQRRGGFSVEDRINLSYYYLRLGQPAEALGVLKVPEAQAARHFMVFANLGTAYQVMAGGGSPKDRARNLGDALLYLREAQGAWPRQWPKWTKDQADWFKEAEKQQIALVRLRLREAVRAGAGSGPATDAPPFADVDALFPVHFVGEGGKYEAGKLAAAERAKLKGNEVALVQQLLTWLPGDSRLYWLYGELLNAEGDVATAQRILEDCVKNRLLSNVTLLRDHRNVLNEAKVKRPEVADLLPTPPSQEAAPSDSGNQSGESGGWQPSVGQVVLVGGVGGLVIAVLAYLQIKEIRRRRLSRGEVRRDRS
jgi:hypothetical protein